MNPLQVVVFGGTGFLGRRLVAGLLEDGHRVRVAARHPAGFDLKPDATDGLELVRADILEADEVERAVADTDLVFNLVGAVMLPGSKAYHDLHERGARNVAVAAHAAGAAGLVHFSALGISDEAPSAADRSKAAGEREVRAAFPGATLVRPSLVYGENDHFLSGIDHVSRLSPVIPLIGDATRVQPVYVGDLVQGLVRLARDAGRQGGVIQAAGPRTYALKGLVESFLAARRRRRLIIPVPHPLASALGRLVERLPNAPVNRELARLMRTDKVAEPDLPGLEALGVEPRSIEDWLAGSERY